MSEVKIEIGQTVEVTVGNFKNRLGQPATIDTTQPVTWEIEEADAFVITPGEVTPTSATASFRHIGTEEISAGITFTADGDTDSDEESIITVNDGRIVEDTRRIAPAGTH